MRQSRGKFITNLKDMVEYRKILGGLTKGSDIGWVICLSRLSELYQ